MPLRFILLRYFFIWLLLLAPGCISYRPQEPGLAREEIKDRTDNRNSADSGFVTSNSGRESDRTPNNPFQKWVWISQNPVLSEALREVYSNLPEDPQDLENNSDWADLSYIAEVENTTNRSNIQDFRSWMYSVLSLTLGSFQKIESQMDFKVLFLNSSGTIEKNYTVKVERDFLAVFPPYIGLGTTIFLSLADRGRIPESLLESCLYPEKISKLESALSGYPSDSCRDYKLYVKTGLEALKPKLAETLNELSQKIKFPYR
jgi:hypothetical protein